MYSTRIAFNLNKSFKLSPKPHIINTIMHIKNAIRIRALNRQIDSQIHDYLTKLDYKTK